MKINKNYLFNFYLILIFLIIVQILPLTAQEQNKIIERVEVKNIEIPVRVFDGKKNVAGLKKEDFQLYINGKKKSINGFYEIRKKLGDKQSTNTKFLQNAPHNNTPRFFVLLFNLSAINEDLTTQLNILFDRIIKKKDRLMVITNRYIIPEWEVEDAAKSKRIILEMLEKETNVLKSELIFCENELRALAQTALSRLADEVTEPRTAIFQDFFLNYQFVLEDLREEFLNIPIDQYIRIADYLKSVPIDKWVLSFYQIGRLPLLDSFGAIFKVVDFYLNTATGQNSSSTGGRGGHSFTENPQEVKQKLHEYYSDYMLKLQMTDNIYFDDIAKSFLNSGATVHTQILLPMERYFSSEFQYKSVSTQSESILKKLSHLTGGTVQVSNRTETFINKIAKDEDVIYMLTYVPDPKKRNTKLEIKIKNKNYRLVYDNQSRLKSFKSMMQEVEKAQKILEIESIACVARKLKVVLENIQMMQYEGESLGAIEARIKIMDKQNHIISSIDKSFKGLKESAMFEVALPQLSKGEYNVVVEVTDLFSLQRVKAGDAITIHQN